MQSKKYITNISEFFSQIFYNLFLFILFSIPFKLYSADINEIEKKVLATIGSNSNKAISDYTARNVSIQSKLTAFKNQLRECQESNLNTNTVCVQGNNKTWNQASSMIGSIADVGGMAMSASCSKFANALKLVQAAQTGIRGTCAFQKGDCIDKCTKAEKTAALLKSDLNGLLITSSQAKSNINEKISSASDQGQSQPIGTTCSEAQQIAGDCQTPSKTSMAGVSAQNHDERNVEKAENALSTITSNSQQAIESLDNFSSDEESPTTIKRLCTATANEASSKMAMNLSSLMMSMQGNQACAAEMAKFDSLPGLQDCTLTGTCTVAEVPNECLDPKNKDAIYCKTPNLTTDTRGSGGGGMGSTKPTAPDFNLDSKSLPNLNMDGLGGGGADGAGNMANIGDTPGPKSAGVPGGGGGGGLNIPGGGAGPNKTGGGGRGVSSDGPSYGASPGYAGAGIGSNNSGDKKNEDLQQYLPGGAKDPNLAKLGGPEGITASSGPTIFEKVSKGYKNNRSTLIPE